MRRLKLLLSLTAILLCAGTYSKTLTVYKATGITTTTTSLTSSIGDNEKLGRFSCIMYGKNNSGTLPTMDAKIQECETTTGPCFDVCVFTQCTTGNCNTSGYEYRTPFANQAILPILKGVITLAGTNPNYDVTLELKYQ